MILFSGVKAKNVNSTLSAIRIAKKNKVKNYLVKRETKTLAYHGNVKRMSINVFDRKEKDFQFICFTPHLLDFPHIKKMGIKHLLDVYNEGRKK